MLLVVAAVMVFFGESALAQRAKPSDIQTVGGFLKFCGPDADFAAKRRKDAVAAAAPGRSLEALQQVMADELSDQALCLGYIAGIDEGWQEGNEHGVLASFFPEHVPSRYELEAALKKQSYEQVAAGSAAMKNDVFCTPEHMTFGDLRDTIVRYYKFQVSKNPLFAILPTARLFHEAMKDAYPCPVSAEPPPKTLPPVKRIDQHKPEGSR